MNLKIKIMNRQPQVSDEEVKGYMDFDGLLHQHNKIIHRRNLIFKSGAVVLVVASLVAVYVSYTGNLSESTKTEMNESEPSTESMVVQPEDGQPVVNDSITTRDTKRSEQRVTASDDKQVTERETDNNDAPQGQSDETQKKRLRVEELRPENVYVQAEPLDGYDKLFEYFRANLKYPEEALSDSVEGVVTVSFVVTPDGKADNISIRNSLGEAFDREATTLVSNMPLWKPATLNGKAVPSKMSLPLNFELKKISR